jgi:hypothetical protein
MHHHPAITLSSIFSNPESSTIRQNSKSRQQCAFFFKRVGEGREDREQQGEDDYDAKRESV